MKTKLLTLFACCILSLSQWIFAFTIPASPENYVNDYAHMLSPEATNQLNQVLGDFEKKTSNQLVVVTIPSLDNQPMEDYSIHLAERWKIGTHEHDNGIILLLSKAEHQIRIEVGYGLEGALPDATAKQIILNEITPSMRAGHFDQGIEQGVRAIMQATLNEYQGKSQPSTSMSAAQIENLIVTILIIAYLLLRVLGFIRGGLLFGLGMSSHIHTPFWDAVTRASSGGGSSSGGGFGGGGGGGFGGGGASGSW